MTSRSTNSRTKSLTPFSLSESRLLEFMRSTGRLSRLVPSEVTVIFSGSFVLRFRAPPRAPLAASIGSGDDPVNPSVMAFTHPTCLSCQALYNICVLHLSATRTYRSRGMLWPNGRCRTSSAISRRAAHWRGRRVANARDYHREHQHRLRHQRQGTAPATHRRPWLRSLGMVQAGTCLLTPLQDHHIRRSG